jgi:hypothetical protein
MKSLILYTILLSWLLVSCGGRGQTAVSPTSEPPITFTGQAGGCGDIFLYKANDSHTEYLRLSLNAAVLSLSTTPITIDLAQPDGNITADIDVYSDAVETLGEFPYCNDVGPSAVPQANWQAVSGTATITLSTDSAPFNCQGAPYEITVLLQNVVFHNGNQERLLDTTHFDTITVGWCAG